MEGGPLGGVVDSSVITSVIGHQEMIKNKECVSDGMNVGVLSNSTPLVASIYSERPTLAQSVTCTPKVIATSRPTSCPWRQDNEIDSPLRIC